MVRLHCCIVVPLLIKRPNPIFTTRASLTSVISLPPIISIHQPTKMPGILNILASSEIDCLDTIQMINDICYIPAPIYWAWGGGSRSSNSWKTILILLVESFNYIISVSFDSIGLGKRIKLHQNTKCLTTHSLKHWTYSLFYIFRKPSRLRLGQSQQCMSVVCIWWTWLAPGRCTKYKYFIIFEYQKYVLFATTVQWNAFSKAPFSSGMSSLQCGL